jgi:hypothetical protein
MSEKKDARVRVGPDDRTEKNKVRRSGERKASPGRKNRDGKRSAAATAAGAIGRESREGHTSRRRT